MDIPIAERLEQLNSAKKACATSHPFLKAFHLSAGQHWQVTTQIDGIVCEDSYARVVRNPAGAVVDAVLFKEPRDGVFEQVYVGGSAP